MLATNEKPLVELGRKSTALLSILALSPNLGCTRERLFGILWGARSQQQAQASLRQALSEIRRALNSDRFEPLITDRTTVKLASSLVEVDVLQCTNLLRSQNQNDQEKAAELIEADFAPPQSINEEFYDDWMSQQHERLRETFQHRLSELMREALDQMELSRTLVFARALLAMERGDEEAHRVLMQVYAHQGNRTLALKQFDTCKIVLETEYDAKPDASTVQLLEQIKQSKGRATAPEPMASPAYSRRSEARHQVSVSSNMLRVDGNDVEAGRLATEFVEQLLGALSCFRWIDISRVEGIMDPGAAAPIDATDNAIRRPDFVIEGLARRSARRLYIKLDVVDSASRNISFSEVFEGDLTAEGFIPELLIHQVAARLEERLRTTIVRMALQKTRDELSAIECALLALYGVHDMSLQSYDTAAKLFALAESKSPTFAFQYSCKALWMIFSFGQQWGSVQREEIHQLAKRATFLDPEDATSLAIFGHMEVFCFRRFDVAADLFNRAIACNPHSPFVWMMRSVFLAYSGEAAAARRALERSHEISDMEAQYRFMKSSAHCIVSLIDRDFEEAARWGRILAATNPGFSNGVKQLLVSLGQLGYVDEAHGYLEQLSYLEPEFSTRSFVDSYPLKRLEDRELFRDGLQASGAPP